jgi:pimeloyl-ACP methyl ester carboxylesterase
VQPSHCKTPFQLECVFCSDLVIYAGYSGIRISYIINYIMRPTDFLPYVFLFCSFTVSAQAIAPSLQKFSELYQQELGFTGACEQQEEHVFRVCSSALRNDGNAPYILHHQQASEKVVVLFHGLSDSPYFLKTIAEALYQQGHTVVVALSPGHGKLDADLDMQDPNLAQRWYQHVEQIMTLAAPLGKKHYIGGFSTGGTLAVHYSFRHPENVDGLLLFSGALQLGDSVEFLLHFWGMGMLTNWLDGDYQTEGPNPYKYPSVGRHSALMLMNVIDEIRDFEDAGKPLNLPIFAAHSKVDATVMFSGVEDLLAYNEGSNALFAIDEGLDVCHADLVINQQQLIDMHFDMSKVEDPRPCSIPHANPIHAEMLEAMVKFMRAH